MEKEDLRSAGAVIGVVVLALLYSGVIFAIYPGWDFFIDFIKSNIFISFSSSDVFLSLLLGVISGVISGWMTGVLITRINRFSSIKSEALGHLNSVEYPENEGAEYADEGTISQIKDLANELYRFGHKSAGNIFNSVHFAIDWEMCLFRSGQSNIENIENTLSQCRRKIRELRPSQRVFIPWGEI